MGLARSHLALGDPAKALESALSAVELNYFNPGAHYLLGVCLFKLGRTTEALQALELATHQAPLFPAAYRTLAQLHQHLGHWDQAAWCKSRMEMIHQLRLPRSTPSASATSTAHKPILRRELPPSWESKASWPSVAENEIITVVAGLPRSGTSMLMQMLEAGGLRT